MSSYHSVHDRYALSECGSFTLGTVLVAPPSVSNLALVSMATNNESRVSVNISWDRPSDRNGPFSYNLTYSGTQPGAYSTREGTTNMRMNIPLDDSGGDVVYEFIGLPSTEYTVEVLAINTKTGLFNPNTTTVMTTVSIGITLAIIMSFGQFLDW